MAGPDSNRAGHRARCVRFWFEDGPRSGHAKPSGLGMVSTLQHTAGSATEATAAPRRCTLHCRTSPRCRWPGAVALVMWNMRKIHFSHSWKTPAAEAAVKADRREPRQRSERSGEPLRTTERRVPRVSAKKADSPRLSTNNHDESRFSLIKPHRPVAARNEAS